MSDVALVGSMAIEPIPTGRSLPATQPDVLAEICEFEEFMLSLPQADIVTHHVIHAGIYSRTIMVPAGVVLTGALVKIPTILTVCGRCGVVLGDGQEVLVEGYFVVPASAGRKQVFTAHTDTFLTMSFRTEARTVEEAEREFTDDHERLMSRAGVNHVNITGE